MNKEKPFEFGAYLLITHYLAKNHGINELERFARFRAETGARYFLSSFSGDLNEIIIVDAV